MTDGQRDITELLVQFGQGDQQAGEALLPLVHDALLRIARRQMHRERAAHSLQPTALVNEAFLRFAGMRGFQWESRLHFLAMAATLMRRVLVDHARELQAAKRGSGCTTVPLDDVHPSAPQADAVDVLSLHQALDRLNQMHPRQARIVELRYFAGLTDEEIAELLHLSSRTVKREWRVAKAFLFEQLSR